MEEGEDSNGCVRNPLLAWKQLIQWSALRTPRILRRDEESSLRFGEPVSKVQHVLLLVLDFLPRSDNPIVLVLLEDAVARRASQLAAARALEVQVVRMREVQEMLRDSWRDLRADGGNDVRVGGGRRCGRQGRGRKAVGGSGDQGANHVAGGRVIVHIHKGQSNILVGLPLGGARETAARGAHRGGLTDDSLLAGEE